MPSFSDYPAQKGKKILYLGHSGAGKTGSLCALAAAGYRVRILDLDNKAEVIRGFVSGKPGPSSNSIYLKEFPGLWTAEQAATTASRISYIPCAEAYSIIGTKTVPQGSAWPTANRLLTDWRDGDDRPGALEKWTSNDVLVIDSFSRFCEAAMNYHLVLNNRAAEGPRVGNRDSNDYSATYKMITDFLNLLKCSQIQCHVIVIGHIVFMEEAGPQVTATKVSKGYAQVFGRALISPTVSQYFPHVIRAKSVGSEPSVRRTIVTNNDENVELITPAPLQVKREYSLDTGLAQYFKDSTLQ